MHHLKLHPNGLGETCQVKESVEHYIMECKESNLIRIIEQKCIELNIKPELESILNNEEILNSIYEKISRKI